LSKTLTDFLKYVYSAFFGCHGAMKDSENAVQENSLISAGKTGTLGGLTTSLSAVSAGSTGKNLESSGANSRSRA